MEANVLTVVLWSLAPGYLDGLTSGQSLRRLLSSVSSLPPSLLAMGKMWKALLHLVLLQVNYDAST